MNKALLIIVSTLFFAGNGWTQTSQEQKTETTSTSEKISQLDQFNQAFWGLSQTEWDRYQKVKPIAKLLGQAETTPVEVLGIFAETEAERKRYAQAYVKKMDAYVSNLQQFQRVASQIQSQYYTDIPMIDPDKINELRNAPIRSNDRIQYFTRLDCSSCDLILLKLVRQVRMYGAKLDVFFEAASDEQIQQYALDKKLPAELVGDGQITLNTDNGFIAKHKIKTPRSYISKSGGELTHHDPDL